MKINHKAGALSDPYHLPAHVSRNDTANVRSKAEHKAGAQPTQLSAGDRVSVSRDALLLAEGMRAAHASEDIRSDKVAALRQSIEDGSYAIDGKRLAARLAQEEPGLFRA